MSRGKAVMLVGLIILMSLGVHWAASGLTPFGSARFVIAGLVCLCGLILLGVFKLWNVERGIAKAASLGIAPFLWLNAEWRLLVEETDLLSLALWVAGPTLVCVTCVLVAWRWMFPPVGEV